MEAPLQKATMTMFIYLPYWSLGFQTTRTNTHVLHNALDPFVHLVLWKAFNSIDCLRPS